jgi:trimethylamine--corrinoid protein Co-methyltransferase
MKQQTTWSSADERELLVEEAIAVLGTVGVRIEGSARLDELREAGATVDAGSHVVRFGADVVHAAVEACPRSFIIGGATPDDDLLVEEGAPSRFCPSGCGAFTLDMDSGERRPSTLEDLRLATAVFDELPQIDTVWTTVAANDVVSEHRELIEYGTVLLETAKHVIFVESPNDAAPLRDLAEALAGSLGSFARRPRFSTLLTVASPLQIDGRLLDVHAAGAALGAPVFVYTVPMAGGTSPITPAGTMVATLAEFLAAACALQALTPGARLVMGASPTVLDMRTGAISYGACETGLMAAACTEVAHSLGIPVSAPGMATEAKYPGPQAAFEKALKALTLAAAGADFQSGGIGQLDTANLLSLPQAVIDAEIVAMIKRLLGDTEISRQTAQREAIERVGIGGSFLGEKETRRRHRAGEYLTPVVATRQSYQAWAQDGRSELDVARQRVTELLDRHAATERPYDADTVAAVRQVCRLD